MSILDPNTPSYSYDPCEEELMAEYQGGLDYHTELWAAELKSMENEGKADAEEQEWEWQQTVLNHPEKVLGWGLLTIGATLADMTREALVCNDPNDPNYIPF